MKTLTTILSVFAVSCHVTYVMVGEKSPYHSSSERTDVKLIERTRNLSVTAWLQQSRSTGRGNNYTGRGVYPFMVLRERFPACAWCLRKFASRTARYISVCVLALIIVPAIALRVEAALFERKAIATVRALSTLKVGVTSEAEAVARMRVLGLVTGPYGPPLCFAEECISVTIPNSRFSDAIFLPVIRTENPTLYSVLTWWGFRFRSLSVDVNFTSGKVSFFSYHLMLSNSRFDGGADVVVVRVTSQEKLLARSGGSLSGDDAYRLTPSGAWPDKSVGIALTPNTPQDLVNRAFDVKLHCLWSLAGCKAWREVLPDISS
jgi:hypothetical protein